MGAEAEAKEEEEAADEDEGKRSCTCTMPAEEEEEEEDEAGEEEKGEVVGEDECRETRRAIPTSASRDSSGCGCDTCTADELDDELDERTVDSVVGW